MPAYWLLKSEPGTYSIDDLKRDRKTYWDGVRNYQARNLLRDEIKKGDEVLFYHSGKDPGVVGVARVTRGGYPDHTAFDPDDPHYDAKSDESDPRWFMIDVRFVRKLPRCVSLKQLKETRSLGKMHVTKNSRLSVQPVTRAEFNVVMKLAEKPA